jgi:ATP-dependent DNA ligase
MSSLRLRTRRSRPGFIEPCEPVLAARPPAGPDWLHEIKHDGYRLIARRDGAGVRLITRGGYDWSDRFPGIVAAVGGLKVKSCVLDGEAVVLRDDGTSCFHSLRSGPRVKPNAALCAFDLIELDGEDWRRVPVEKRRERLLRLISRGAAIPVCSSTRPCRAPAWARSPSSRLASSASKASSPSASARPMSPANAAIG